MVCQEQAITDWLADQVRNQEGFHQVVIRTLHGSKCSSKQSFMKEIARALAFPPYFGHNWDALDECLADLADWLPASGYVLVFLDSDRLLTDSERDFRILTEILQGIAAEWANLQPPVPFHAILQCPPNAKDRMLARVQATGVSFSCWDCADENL